MYGKQLLYQVEHHVFPNLSGLIYEKMQPEFEELCKKYGIQYNHDNIFKSTYSVFKRLLKHSIP